MDASALINNVISLSRSHPHAPPIDVFDLVMRGSADQVLDFAGQADPGTAFGQLIAAAFDPCMTPREWAAFTGPGADASLRDGCMQVWRTHVMPRFAARYAVTVQGV